MHEILANNPIFSSLSKEELDFLMRIMERQQYEPNQLVFAMNQEARHFYLVESGSFILYLRNNQVKTFKRGDLFGEIAVINENVRTGSIRALQESSLLAFNGNALFNDQVVPPSVSLKIIRSLAKKVTNYLRSREQISTQELIQGGENDYVEFKSNIRWDVEKQRNDKLTERAILKTITAFLNSRGGTLLVGVQDDGEVLGIGEERFLSHDKMLLHLTNQIKDHIGAIHLKFIRFEIEEIDAKYILRVDCEAATLPAYYRDHKEDALYIRTGPSTTNLRVSKVYDYIQMRFSTPNGL
ncbi:MAG: RNA-binding domain-containing protein [Bacteroidota bacterium]